MNLLQNLPLELIGEILIYTGNIETAISLNLQNCAEQIFALNLCNTFDALTNNQFVFIKWLIQTKRLDPLMDITPLACIGSGSKGNLNLLKWSKKTGYFLFNPEWGMEYAIRNENLYIIKWIYKHHNFQEGLQQKFLITASILGHYNIVVWLNENNTCTCCSSKAVIQANQFKHFSIVKYLLLNSYTGSIDEIKDLMLIPALTGNIGMMIFLYDYGIKCTEEAMAEAIINNNFEAMFWIYKRIDKHLETLAMDTALRFGYIDIVKWLFYNTTARHTFEWHEIIPDITINNDDILWIFKNLFGGDSEDLDLEEEEDE